MKLIHNNNIYSRVYRSDSMPYWNVLPANGETPLYFEFLSSVPTSIVLTYGIGGSNEPTGLNFEYSYDNVTWTSANILSVIGTVTFPTNGNSRIYIRGNNRVGIAKDIFSDTENAHPYFKTISVPFKVGGDVRSLMLKKRFTEELLYPLGYYFAYLFKSQRNLKEIELPSVSYWDINNFYNWLSGINRGDIIANVPTGLNPPRNASGVPAGWTINYI